MDTSLVEAMREGVRNPEVGGARVDDELHFEAL